MSDPENCWECPASWALTEEEFTAIFVEVSSEVADGVYPKGVSTRRGEYLRDQAILHVKLLKKLQEKGIVQ